MDTTMHTILPAATLVIKKDIIVHTTSTADATTTVTTTVLELLEPYDVSDSEAVPKTETSTSTSPTEDGCESKQCSSLTVLKRPHSVVQMVSVTDSFSPPRATAPLPTQTLSTTTTSFVPNGIAFSQMNAADDNAGKDDDRKTREQDGVHITEVIRTINVSTNLSPPPMAARDVMEPPAGSSPSLSRSLGGAAAAAAAAAAGNEIQPAPASNGGHAAHMSYAAAAGGGHVSTTDAGAGAGAAAGAGSRGMMDMFMLDMAEPMPELTALEKHILFFLPGQRHVSGSVLRKEEMHQRLVELGLTEKKAKRFSKNSIRVGSLVQGRCPFVCMRGGKEAVIEADKLHQRPRNQRTNIFDDAGDFDEGKWQTFLDTMDKNKDGFFSENELQELLTDNTQAAVAAQGNNAKFGCFAYKNEFELLIELFGDDHNGERGISVESLRKFYDGTLFYEKIGETPPWKDGKPTMHKVPRLVSAQQLYQSITGTVASVQEQAQQAHASIGQQGQQQADALKQQLAAAKDKVQEAKSQMAAAVTQAQKDAAKRAEQQAQQQQQQAEQQQQQWQQQMQDKADEVKQQVHQQAQTKLQSASQQASAAVADSLNSAFDSIASAAAASPQTPLRKEDDL